MSDKIYQPNEGNLNDLVDNILNEFETDIESAPNIDDSELNDFVDKTIKDTLTDIEIAEPTKIISEEKILPESEDSFEKTTEFTDKTQKTVTKKQGRPSNEEFMQNLQENVVKQPKSKPQPSASKKLSRTSKFKLSEDYKKKVLPSTEQMNLTEAEQQEEMLEIRKKRKAKVDDFIIQNDKSPEEKQTVEEFDDYNSIEEAKPILKNLKQTKLSLVLRFIALFIISALLVYLSVATDFSLKTPSFVSKASSPVGYISFNLTLGIIAAITSFTVIINGTVNFFKFKADSDSVCAIALISSFIAPIAMLINKTLINSDKIHLYISIAVVGLLFNTIGKLLIVNRTIRNFRFICGASKKYSSTIIEDEDTAQAFTRGLLTDFPQLCSKRETELLTDFLKTSYSFDYVDGISRVLLPLFTILSAGLAVALGIKTSDISLALSTFAGSMCITAPLSTSIIANIPLSKASKKLSSKSAVVLGYSAVDEFYDTNSILTDAADLFPDGTINLVGFKVFGNKRVDEAFLNAASLCIHANSVLSHIFYDIIGGKVTMLKPVESFIYEDSMGMSGWIDNRRVLLGSRELMKNHSIILPPLSKEQRYINDENKHVIYLSVSGELCAMFIVEMKPSLEVTEELRALDKRNVNIILKTVDSIITVSSIADTFGITPSIIKVLPFRLHESFDNVTSYTPRSSGAVACDGKFSSFASAIVSCKKIHKLVRFVSSMHIASVILGFVLTALFAFVSSGGYFGPASMLIYGLAWAIIIVLAEILCL